MIDASATCCTATGTMPSFAQCATAGSSQHAQTPNVSTALLDRLSQANAFTQSSNTRRTDNGASLARKRHFLPVNGGHAASRRAAHRSAWWSFPVKGVSPGQRLGRLLSGLWVPVTKPCRSQLTHLDQVAGGCVRLGGVEVVLPCTDLGQKVGDRTAMAKRPTCWTFPWSYALSGRSWRPPTPPT